MCVASIAPGSGVVQPTGYRAVMPSSILYRASPDADKPLQRLALSVLFLLLDTAHRAARCLYACFMFAWEASAAQRSVWLCHVAVTRTVSWALGDGVAWPSGPLSL